MSRLPSPFDPILQSQGFVMLDGGLASELEFRGAILDDALWSAKVLLESADSIRQLHLDYFQAGADVAISASYQATYEGLAKKGLGKAASELVFQQSIVLAQEASQQFSQQSGRKEKGLWPLVAASIGPYGAFLADGSEYRGDYGLSKQALVAFHRNRLQKLLSFQPDLLAVETIPCLLEAEAIIELLRETPSKTAYLSFSCRDEQHLSSEEPFAAAVALANTCPQLIAVGINCTAPQLISPLLRTVQDSSALPFLVYPNKGESWDAKQKCWLPTSPSFSIHDQLEHWYELGVRIFGGCCRVRPADIAEMRVKLERVCASSYR